MNLELFSSEAERIGAVLEAPNEPALRERRLTEIAKQCRGNHHATQTQRLALALKELKSVSTYECRRYLDIYCPPARKFDLVQQGHYIETHWQTIQVESGQQHRVGLYVLRQGNLQAACAARES